MEAVVNAGHDIGGVISNVALCAIVLVSVVWRHVKNAIPERSEADGRMPDLGLVRERHAEKAQIIDHWCGDGDHEKEDAGCEEEENTNRVSATVNRHIHCVVVANIW